MLNWKKVDSSNVHSLAYHEQSETLCVRFLSGGTYSYRGVPVEVFTDLNNAESVGKYINRIKKLFPCDKWASEEDLTTSLAVN